jgi:hypothetical protein
VPMLRKLGSNFEIVAKAPLVSDQA